MVGSVRVAMPTAVAREFMLDELPSFRARYPDIVLEFASAVAVVDLPGRDADLALRTLRPTQPSLVARKLHGFRYVLACAPSLLEGRASVELGALAWIHWDAHAAHIAEARWLDQHLPEANIVMRGGDMSTILRAAQLGVVAIVVAEPLACVTGGIAPSPRWPCRTWPTVRARP